MSVTDNGAEKALRVLEQISKWSKERNITPDDMKYFMFPMAVFDSDGKIELANDMLLEGTGLTDDDIKTGKRKITNICEPDFLDAMELALRGEIRTVYGLKDVMWCIGQRATPYNAPDYKSAILFPMFNDDAPTRGVVMFLPFEYRSEKV